MQLLSEGRKSPLFRQKVLMLWRLAYQSNRWSDLKVILYSFHTKNAANLNYFRKAKALNRIVR